VVAGGPDPLTALASYASVNTPSSNNIAQYYNSSSLLGTHYHIAWIVCLLLSNIMFKINFCTYISRCQHYVQTSVLHRDAMLARYMLSSCVYLSVRPSVCPFVTSRCSTKNAKLRITQTTPYDSPWTLPTKFSQTPSIHTFITSSLCNVLAWYAALALHLL